MRNLISVILILGLMFVPVISYSDESIFTADKEGSETGIISDESEDGEDIEQNEEDVCERARLDASKRVKGLTWFALGCLIPAVGIIASYVVEPTPSGLELIGKSSEYVETYTACYTDKGRSIQIGNAWLGCATGCLTNILIYAAYLGVMSLAL